MSGASNQGDEPLVLFLGAGASRAFGFPLTNDILPLVADRVESKTLFPDLNVTPAVPGDDRARINEHGFVRDAMEVLRADLGRLLPAAIDRAMLRPAKDATPLSITDLLSLIDSWLQGRTVPAPQFSVDRLARLRNLIERAIATVVSQPAHAEVAAHEAPRLAKLVKELVARSGKGAVVITTNYDMALEKPLVAALGNEPQVDYGCNWRDPFRKDPVTAQHTVRKRPEKASLAFLKLHGSIGWLRCDLCEHVYINSNDAIFQGAYISILGPDTACSCGHQPLSPLLVAPSMVRDIREPNLLSIWQAALEALRCTPRWAFVGYSLTPEDIAIRSMLIRAFGTAPAKPAIDVYEHGAQRTVELRYRSLFGDRVRMHAGGMAEFVDKGFENDTSSSS